MRVVRSSHANARLSVDRYRRRPRDARRSCGLDRRRRRRYSADRLSPEQDRRPRRLSPARAGDRSGALCRRAGRRGVCRRSLSRRRRRRPGRARTSRNCRCCCDADQAPGEFAPGRSTAAGDVRKEYGDLDAAFRNAHAIVALELSVGRHSGVPLETRGAIGRYDGAREVLELHGAAKVPHWNRDQIAGMLGLSPSRVHLYEGHVGGGFGIRGELYPEDVLVCAAALRFRRPVKWIEDRREHLIAANHSRAAAASRPRGDRCRGPHPRHRRRVLSRPGRLCAHPRAPRCPT